MTFEQLRKALPHAKQSDFDKYSAPLMNAMNRFGITTPVRQAAFLAQLAHESGSLKYDEEIASGDAYDTRTDLGNTPEVDGDGRLWKGRGPMQLTGKTNYQAFADYIGDQSIMTNPDKVKEPLYGALSAGWFWAKYKALNTIADLNTLEAYFKISVKINGMNKKTRMPNHWDERKARWAEAKKALEI
jgi:putative chitinase